MKLDSYRRLTFSHIVLDPTGLASGERTKQLTEAASVQLTEARGCQFKAGRVEKIQMDDRDGKTTVVG